MQNKKFTLKKINKLKSKKKFQFVYGKGRTVVDPLSVFYVLAGQQDDLKLGLAVGKKLGCAVVRNKVKRKMREVFRHHQSELKKGYHIVWVARQKLTKADLKTFERVFLRLAKRAALLQE
ncbi:MAG: ribonuclease P protein component [Phascolarctobacterium sp.]|nr:ribonuclease P protein component [Phascolarctobacterium sp.]